MTPFSGQPKVQIFAENYRFLSFPQNMGMSVSKKVSSKYSEKFLDHGKGRCTLNCFNKSDSKNSESSLRFNWK